MIEPIALGSETRRVDLGKGGVMLYDASRASNLQPTWFDPEWWRARGALDGGAQGRGTAWFVDDGPRPLVLRHYRRGGLAARVSTDRYLFLGESRTRPVREWQVTYHLHRRGLPVPAPVAARFVRDGWTYSGDILLERLPAVTTLAQRLRAAPLPLSDWIALGRCVRRFHDAGLCHPDLNAHNILFVDGGEIHLIDFDGATLRTRGLWSDANLARLRRSLLKVTDAVDPSGARFADTDWHSLLAAYFESGAGVSNASARPHEALR